MSEFDRNIYVSVPDDRLSCNAMDKVVSEHRRIRVVTNYTGSISKAWTLLADLRKDERFCCIQLDSDHDFTWGINLIEDRMASRDCADFEAAQAHHPSLRLCVSDVGMPLLITVAYIWAKRLQVPRVEMPWEERKRAFPS